MADTPAISIVMPTLNAGRTISRALRSLRGQSEPYETILIDGGSSDDTLRTASATPGVRIISAPSTSIYEALNRGIMASSAPAICLLNADDELLPDALETFASTLARNRDVGIVRGWPSFVEERPGGELVRRIDVDRRTHRALTLGLLLRGPCAINSLCIRRATFDRIGTFDDRFRLAADREWMLRAWTVGVAIAEAKQPVYRYLIHDGSSTLDRSRRNYAEIRREHLSIIARYARDKVMRSDPRFAAALVRWHTAESAMLSAALLRRGAWLDAVRATYRGVRTSPLWARYTGIFRRLGRLRT